MKDHVNLRSVRRLSLTGVLLGVFLGVFGGLSPADAKDLFEQDRAGVAIQGYDTVAYFTDGEAVKGSEEFSFEWLGAVWHFASAEHRDLFAADPVKYAPQYGGYCTSGIVDGNIHASGAKAWVIVDGKLYLNGSQYSLDKWAENEGEKITATDANWEELKVDLTQ